MEKKSETIVPIIIGAIICIVATFGYLQFKKAAPVAPAVSEKRHAADIKDITDCLPSKSTTVGYLLNCKDKQ